MDADRNHDDLVVALCIAGLIVLPLLIVVLIVSGIARGVSRWREARQDQRILDAAVRQARAWDAYAAQRHAAVNRFLQRAARP